MPNERIFTVKVFRDGTYVDARGVDDFWRLDAALEDLAKKWCSPPREWELTPEGWIDPSRPKPRPRIEVSIWDASRERWHHPGGVAMPENWSGLLWLRSITNVGSYRIE